MWRGSIAFFMWLPYFSMLQVHVGQIFPPFNPSVRPPRSWEVSFGSIYGFIVILCHLFDLVGEVEYCFVSFFYSFIG